VKFHAFAPLEANMRVTNGIHLGLSLSYWLTLVNLVQTLKVDEKNVGMGLDYFGQKFALEDAIGYHALTLLDTTP
jgi:hypothetical protein